MSYYGLFELPVVKTAYEKIDDVKQLTQNIITTKPEYRRDNNLVDKLVHYFRPSDENMINTCPEFAPFFEWMHGQVKFYGSYYLGCHPLTNWVCTASWINVNSGSDQAFHSHTNALVCATYYVEFDPKQHPPLVFKNPRYIGSTLPFMDCRLTESHPYTSNEAALNDIAEGDMVLWPAEVEHGYRMRNEPNKPRISISTNWMPEIVTNGHYGFGVRQC